MPALGSRLYILIPLLTLFGVLCPTGLGALLASLQIVRLIEKAGPTA